ncbi:glycosyltransferase family 39 protein [Candidatus Woesearchaeota archaeon]|nr:glycosyltransferase family 39 protein [Candidatus Woesearchaeota archaeon]
MKIDKIKEFTKNRNNQLFLLIIIIAVLIRGYYFYTTLDQPLWWDEAEYMMMAKSMAFDIEHHFEAVRPVLFSFISALWFKVVGYSELFPRFLMFLLSIITVMYTYLLGKTIYNEKVGLIASSLMAVSPLSLFFTTRLLVDLPSLCFFTVAGYYFYNYIKTENNKNLYTAFIITGIGTLFRITTAVILIVVLIYLILTEKLSFLKKKEYWIGVTIFILILLPYIIWGYIMFKGFVITKAGAVNAPTEPIKQGFQVLINYIKLFPYYFSWLGVVILTIGLISLYKIFIGLDLIIKNKAPELNKELFIFLLFIVPFIFLSFSINHNEDRYIINSFPGILIISGLALTKLEKFIKEKYSIISKIAIIIIIIFIAVTQIKVADKTIEVKKDSYSQIKEAGLFLKENTPIDAVIVTSSIPQIELYSERKIIQMPGTKEDLDKIRKDYNNVYLLFSAFEKSPNYVYSYPQENKLQLVHTIFLDKEKKQPLVVAYKL